MKKTFVIISLLLIGFVSYSQNDDWIREFWTDKNCGTRGLIETYDKGYVLMISIRPGPVGTIPIWTWLIKLDINGEILWEKKVGNGINATGIRQIIQSPDGGFLLAGGTTLIDTEKGDVIFMKLNACGEKEWCRIFHNTGEYTLMDFGYNIFPLQNNEGYIALVGQWGNDFVPGTGVFKGIWLFRLAMDGSLVWIKNIFDEVHPNYWNEIPGDMLLSKFLTEEGKQKVIITAWPIYNDYGLPYGWDKTMLCAADVDGNELWWTIHHQDESYYSKPEFSIEDKYGNIYTVGRDESYDDSLANYYPTLFKTDKYGNALFQEYVMDSVYQSNSFCINIMNDTILDIGGIWSYENQPIWAAIARCDTNGNLIMEKKVRESDLGIVYSLKTFDNKELFFMPYNLPQHVTTYLYKFNSNLEYDTLYTQPFDYDYMCDDLPIVSDTIGIDDCDVWTSLPGEIEYRMAQYLIIYPNPAENEITIKLPVATADEHKWGPMTSRHFNHRYHENSALKIFDIYGRLIEEISLKDVEGEEINRDVSVYSTGIYLVNLFENQKLMASGKFVKK
jgi:hypothetical protein